MCPINFLVVGPVYWVFQSRQTARKKCSKIYNTMIWRPIMDFDQSRHLMSS